MDTPIYDFINNLNSSGTLRCFMPGHKGKSPENILENLYRYDITEIKGADSLFESEGIIAQSEKNASELFGTAYTAYSASGSTLCIQTMLTLMKWENRKAFAVRNVHRSFLSACVLLDLDVSWIYPEYTGGIISGEISCEKIEDVLKKYNKPSFLYITSPDYTGRMCNIKKISQICRKYNSRLLVDNAHGAHLAFMPENIHPIYLGADLCCDSAHKMLPALTGSAYIHTSNPKYAEKIKKAMLLYASTSPSYPVMMSLDLCNKYISDRIHNDIQKNISYISALKKSFDGQIEFADGEPFHITIKGFDGNIFAELLRQKNVECEYSDFEYTVLLMSPVNTKHDYEILSDALKYAVSKAPRIKNPEKFYFPETIQKLSIRDAVFAESENIPVEKSSGKICSETNVPCPPAIPIAVSGEIITDDIINIYKRYGIFNINVVK